MKSFLKQYIKKVLWACGFELKKVATSNSDLALTSALLIKSAATLVVDVGANEGQFAQELLAIKPDIKIVSFEPLTQAHQHLTTRARRYKNWVVAKRMALGENKATMEINISRNSVSSSLLPMQSSHSDAAPDSAYCAQEEVEVSTLSNIASDYWSTSEKLFLKIDTQGYEDKVINGAAEVLNQIVAIKLEVSFVELYAGQELALDMINRITGLGYKLFGIANGFRNKKNGALLQADVYFIKNDSSPNSITG